MLSRDQAGSTSWPGIGMTCPVPVPSADLTTMSPTPPVTFDNAMTPIRSTWGNATPGAAEGDAGAVVATGVGEIDGFGGTPTLPDGRGVKMANAPIATATTATTA